MSDQWDTKYPSDRPTWDDLYVKARAGIAREGSPWRPAFEAVVAAKSAGAFDDLQAVFEEMSREDTWHYVLWEACKLPFLPEWQTWPAYAQAVYEAVPDDWLKTSGRLAGIPLQWRRKDERRRLWAFKVTVLFVGGLIEGKLRPSAAPGGEGEQAMRAVDRVPGSAGQAVAASGGEGATIAEARIAQVLESRLGTLLGKLDELVELVRSSRA